MKLRINGIDFVGFTHMEASRSFLNIAGKFSFLTSPKDLANNGYPIKVQQACEVIVEDKIFITGFIEKINIMQTANDVSIHVAGRDKTADLVDSTVDFDILGNGEFTNAITLKQVCEEVIANLGITGMKVIDLVNPAIFSSGNYIAPVTGEGAFDLIEKYAKKRQVLLTTDGLGNVVITQAISGKSREHTLQTNLINAKNGKNNNVVHMHSMLNTENEFNLYRGYSQLAATTINASSNPGGAGSNITPDYLSHQSGEITNDAIRSSRQLVFITNTPVDTETMKQRCIWEKNYRRAKSQFYNCAVSAHTYNGIDIWPVNVLTKVFDDVANITGTTMLIDHVAFTESVEGGKQTQLNLVDKLSYSLQTQANYREALSESLQDAYFTRDTDN